MKKITTIALTLAPMAMFAASNDYTDVTTEVSAAWAVIAPIAVTLITFGIAVRIAKRFLKG